MYKSWLGILLVLICIHCKNTPEVETIENTNEAGYVERYMRRMSDYAKEGLYVKIDPKGNKVEEAQYKNDTLDGWRILYGERGDTQTVENYRMGAFDGEIKVFYDNGKLKLLGYYENNEMTGKWKGYYDNGALKEEVTFADNAENGPFVEYYNNGKIKAEGAYLNGDSEHGELKEYNDAGILIKRKQCSNGICKTVWEKGTE
jgi:antitoxin component YwqK of YwqJK toxin-antitoxin module